MSYLKQLKNAMPVAPLKLLVLNSAAELGNEINNYLVDFRSKENNVYIRAMRKKTTSSDSARPVLTAAREKQCWRRLFAERIFLSS